VDATQHWDDVYAGKGDDELSWTEDSPRHSLELLLDGGRSPRRVIDVGAGRSTLVDQLLTLGAEQVSLLDLSPSALQQVTERLDAADRPRVETVVADVTTWEPPTTWDAWHDRAVLHFLTEPERRQQYVATASRAVAAGGVAVIGVFAPDGPESCSGLPVARASADDLVRLFGDGWTLEVAGREVHHTPWAAAQPFTWVKLRRR
jgi:SAM-dependent methyltransferase